MTELQVMKRGGYTYFLKYIDRSDSPGVPDPNFAGTGMALARVEAPAKAGKIKKADQLHPEIKLIEVKNNFALTKPGGEKPFTKWMPRKEAIELMENLKRITK